MEQLDIKRIKRVRDLYGKIAEVLGKCGEKNQILDTMMADARASKAYLEGYLDEVTKNEIIKKYGNVQGIVDTLPND